MSAWRWKRPRHINIQPPKSRQTVALDSNVGCFGQRTVLLFRLACSVRKIGATVVAGCLHPSYHFSPGILFRPAYAKMLRCLSLWILLRRSPQEVSGKLGSFVLQQFIKESWRFMRHKLNHFPFASMSCTLPSTLIQRWAIRARALRTVNFGFSLSFGISVSLGASLSFLTFPNGLSLSVLSLLHFLFLGFLAFNLPPEMPPSESCFLWIWRLAPLVVLDSCVGAVSHGQSLQPRDAGDKRRLQTSGTLEPPQGRLV